MKKVQAKIKENRKIAPDIWRMSLESTYLGRNSKPGQFVEVRCSDGTETLLRRPLGVHRISGAGIELLYEVIGAGTKALSEKRPGQALDIIGPLGNGFSVGEGMAMLVAGGVGAAPLVALAEELKRKKRDVIALLGARTAAHILCEKEFKMAGCKIFTSTDDGSKGRKGPVTDLLAELLRTTDDERRITIYACGPAAMLKIVAAIAKKRAVQCQVSLEERMACGVGVCLGCPVKVITNNEYKMVCKDGPVFDAQEVAW